MEMTSEELDRWASAYISFQLDGLRPSAAHPLWWAVELFMSEPGAERCWAAILTILAKEPPDPVIEMLAAGPLEDLIEYAGARYIDRIETEARRNPAFRSLLGGVWKSSSPEIWGRVEAARGEAW